jgi:hypothetical protein
MGLKEVLSKMKIVEMEAHGPVGLPVPGPVGRPGGAAPVPARPGAGQGERAESAARQVGHAGAQPAGQPAGRTPDRGASSIGAAGSTGSAGPTSGAAGAAGRTGAGALGEILKSIPELPEIDEKALPAPAGDEDLPDFAAIYQAAGVVEPAHGYSAAKVFEILSAPDFAGLEPRAKAAALAGFLKMNPSGPVPIADVIQDAVHRDQALDKFEQMLRSRQRTHGEQVERENAALQAEIDALARQNREKMDANRRALAAEQARLARWQASKQAEERKLAAAVAPFVEKNPITTDPLPDPVPAEAKKTDR